MAQGQEQNARKLTTHQKAVLIQMLRTFPDERVEIRYAPEADDALWYAQDFLSIFKAIGWDVTGPQAEGLETVPLSRSWFAMRNCRHARKHCGMLSEFMTLQLRLNAAPAAPPTHLPCGSAQVPLLVGSHDDAFLAVGFSVG
jgi:hypothetical protein